MNGYLDNNKCVFGVNIFKALPTKLDILHPNLHQKPEDLMAQDLDNLPIFAPLFGIAIQRPEDLKVIKAASGRRRGYVFVPRPGGPETHTFVITNFSGNHEYHYHIHEFTLCGANWRLVVLPGGADHQFKALTLQLELRDLLVPSIIPMMMIDYTLSIVDQIRGNDYVVSVIDSMVFARQPFGFKEFIPLEDFHDAHNGYIVSDTCMLRVQITHVVKDEITLDMNQI
ncbi:Ubiquitinyl hydrolase 1 protein [Dioscorea alata]|uniref:Ubiquitinyl hydrolase 1 protein n=1 Tax=Dioscorea alata TaxID=55571 RepID=A0ACB7VPI8_DIOAL|nr:Ubiquitinyl hydrolase 1 protein [Dioscorea alata]